MYGLARSLFVAILGAGMLLAGASRLRAQVPQCQCAAVNPFGSCQVAVANYPGQEPGAATVAPVGAQRFLYVVDNSDGFVYRFAFANNQLTLNGCGASSPLCFVSPLGSLPTPTGLTFNPDDLLLYWAIGGQLFRSTADIAAVDFLLTVEPVATVDMNDLADLLGLPRAGQLGGITYHAKRNTFWGVDVVNDVYFEFGLDGKPIIDGDSVRHFVNPRKSPLGPGAFGDTIAYASVDGVDFFDISIGRLTDGRPMMVERVFADEGTFRDREFTFGDPVGLNYALSTFAGAGTVTGLAYWSDTCGVGQHTEVLLDAGSADGPPRVRMITADFPNDTGLADFECTPEGNNVTLRWSTFSPFSTLQVTRTDLSTGETKDVPVMADGSAGESTFVDRNVSDSAYRYAAVLTTNGGFAYPAKTCRVVVGRGTAVASASFIRPETPEDTLPFGMTYVGSRDQILVADFVTGNGHLFDTDLEFRGRFAGPFNRRQFFIIGTTAGVAWVESSDELLWLLNGADGSNFVQRTRLLDGGSLRIERIGDLARIRSPLNLVRPLLGDIAHDPAVDQFWSIDRNNGVAFSFRADGTLSGDSFTMQVPNPRTVGAANGIGGGALAVVETSPNTLVLDWGVGAADEDFAGALDRISYGRVIRGGEDSVFVPGQREFTVDLVTATGSRLFGGTAFVTKGEDEFQFIVAWDTRRIFKLDMSEGIAGKEFVRGDANADGVLNISDPSFILAFLFKQGGPPPCRDAADVDDDETINITDAVVLFRYLFQAGQPPQDPFPECGRDFDAGLTCEVTTCP